MKNTITFCFALIIGLNLSIAQTKKPAAKPATPGTKPYTPPAKTTTTSTPATTTTTKPSSTTTTKPTSVAKPATEDSQVTQDMQEQYDRVNNTSTQKSTSGSSKTTTKTSQSSGGRSGATPSNSSSQSRSPRGSDSDYEITKKEKIQKVAAKPEKRSSFSDDSKFHIGFRGGVNLATIAEAGKFMQENSTNLLGFHGGLVMNIGGKGVSFQPEILFSQIGTKFSNPSFPLSISINTVQVPLLLKFAFGDDSFRFFITAGGYGSYYLNRNITLNGQSEKVNFKSGDARIEYGAAGGAGLQFGSKTKFFVEGRYNYGLGNNGEKVSGVPESYPRTIMASAGVLIPL